MPSSVLVEEMWAVRVTQVPDHSANRVIGSVHAVVAFFSSSVYDFVSSSPDSWSPPRAVILVSVLLLGLGLGLGLVLALVLVLVMLVEEEMTALLVIASKVSKSVLVVC